MFPHLWFVARRRFPLVALVAVIAFGALLSGCSATIHPATIADAQAVARVKTALVNDPDVGEYSIEVHVNGGIATLWGRVRSQSLADRAVELARSVPGIAEVRPEIQVGGDPIAPQGSPDRPLPVPEVWSEIDSLPGLLALGASVGWSIPNPDALKTRVSVSPLIKLGSPRGLGPAVAFDWFHAKLESVGGFTPLVRVQVKPIMAGIGYTVATTRLSITPSIVAGYAFNSISVTGTGATEGLPVEVDNSFAWRIGASAWIDVSRRIALNVSSGYLLTGLRLTVLEGGRLERRDASGDTTILHAGVAYRVF